MTAATGAAAAPAAPPRPPPIAPAAAVAPVDAPLAAASPPPLRFNSPRRRGDCRPRRPLLGLQPGGSASPRRGLSVPAGSWSPSSARAPPQYAPRRRRRCGSVEKMKKNYHI